MNAGLNLSRHYWQAAGTYARNAVFMIVADRGMLVTDFVLATLIPYVVQYLLWTFIYRSQEASSILGFEYTQLMFYYAYVIALGRLNNGYDIVEHLSDAVAEGTLENYLLKPFSYQSQRLWDFLGGGLLYWLPLVILLIVQWLINPLDLNASVAGVSYLVGLAVVFLLSQLLCFYLSFCIAIASFWLVRVDVVLATLTVAAAFFGGALLPPAFWPGWLEPIMTYNPFRFMLAAPAELFVRVDSNLMWTALIGLIAYIAIFRALAGFLWRQGVKSYHGAGG